MSKEVVKQLKEQLAELETKITDYKNGDEIVKFLDTAALFHNYSFHNCLLIRAQCSTAKKVAGYKTWQNEFERHVKRGEHGIKILAPRFFPVKKDKDKPDTLIKPQMVMYFMTACVFDVSQTEGKPLPEWLETTPQQKVVLVKNVLSSMKKEDIPYRGVDTAKYNDSNIQFFTTNDGDTFASLVHDYAHHLLHTRDIKKIEKMGLTDMDKKVEAETVAYLVCKRFNIEHDSAKHIVLWGDRDKPFKHLERVQKVSSEIMGKIRLDKIMSGDTIK